MEITTIGLDLAKSVFQVHGIDATGQVVVRRSLRRAQMLPFFARLPSCLVGMEACGTSHYWARELIKLGHQVRLIRASSPNRLRQQAGQKTAPDQSQHANLPLATREPSTEDVLAAGSDVRFQGQSGPSPVVGRCRLLTHTGLTYFVAARYALTSTPQSGDHSFERSSPIADPTVTNP